MCGTAPAQSDFFSLFEETGIYVCPVSRKLSERMHYSTGGMGYVCQTFILGTKVIIEVVD